MIFSAGFFYQSNPPETLANEWGSGEEGVWESVDVEEGEMGVGECGSIENLESGGVWKWKIWKVGKLRSWEHGFVNKEWGS